uniref:Cyclodeaminase/cyclohydrolase domain-containing protein n=1 Tax=Anguilla anguilla TaxID=7936 RepID=A0A0E9WNV7_ANGAN
MVSDSSKEDRQLVSLSVQQFVRSVGARTPAPGGGSVSALVAALGAALGCMVGQMTYGKKQFESLDSVMRRLIPPFHQAINELLQMVDADSKGLQRLHGRPQNAKKYNGRDTEEGGSHAGRSDGSSGCAPVPRRESQPAVALCEGDGALRKHCLQV